MRFALKPGEVALIGRNDGEIELQYNGHHKGEPTVTESAVLLTIVYNQFRDDPEFVEDLRKLADRHGFLPARVN